MGEGDARKVRDYVERVGVAVGEGDARKVRDYVERYGDYHYFSLFSRLHPMCKK